MFFHRCHNTQIALHPLGVVVDNVVLNHQNKLLLGSKSSAIVFLAFQNAPEAFHRAVVNTMGYTRHALCHSRIIQHVVKSVTCILKATVAVEQRMCVRIGFYCGFECVEHNRIVVAVANYIRDNASVVQVKNGTQIGLVDFCTFIPFELCNIRQPFFIRLLRMEIPVQLVFCHMLRIRCIARAAVTAVFKAIPHKERTAKKPKKRYNKEVKKQLTMSLISDELGQASTKKKEFLGIMEKLIPWSEWVGIVQPHYYKGERGNKPYDLELMLRIYVLQHLYNLADDAARNEIIDSRAFSQFCGVDSSNQVPDGDTIGRFRHILERNQIGEAFFTNVVEGLQKCNLMLKKGTIVDSTLIAAPSSTKNKEKQRDPEAHSVKKGNQWYFGYKEHIGVDADSGLVHTVETTSANVHDSNMVVELLQGTEEEVYGDSGYLGAEKKDDAILVNNEGHPIRYQINKRPSQLKKASGEKFELLKAIEHAKSSVRSKVEHVFCVIKRIFHFCKTRYRGREKLHQHCCTLFALANLYLARNRMKVA